MNLIAEGRITHRRIVGKGSRARVVEGPPMPYVRRTHKGRFTARAKAFHASQNNTIAHLAPYAKRRQDIDRPVRIACAVYLPATKKAGVLTRSGQDWSNHVKALEDAMQRADLIADDSAYYVRGPAPLPDGTPSGVYLADDENPPGLRWALYEVE